MYEYHCPNDGKKLAEIALPPLSQLTHIHICRCGRRVKGKILVERKRNYILSLARCPCGRVSTRVLGHLVSIKCKRCGKIAQF